MPIDKNALAQQLSVSRQGNRLFFGVDPTTKQPDPILARLVEVNGTVMGSKGYGYLNYQPLGGGNPSQAFNLGRVQERAGTPVVVKFRDNQPVIDSVDFARMDDPSNGSAYRSPLFAQHAPDHGWAGGDPDYLDTRRILDLMVRPGGEFTVDVLPGWYTYGGTDLYFGGQRRVDLSGFQPPSGTKRFVGLYLDSDRTVKQIEGGMVARTLPLPEPAWPDGAFKLAACILHGDQTFLDFEYVKQRKRIWAGGGAAWPFNNVVTATSQGELETAIAAATGSTLILLDNDIQLTSTVSITKSVTLANWGGYQGAALTAASGSRLFTITGTNDQFVTFINLSLAGGNADMLFVTNSSLRMVGCTFRLPSGVTGDQACIATQSTNARTADIVCEVVDCDFINDDPGDSYGFGIWAVNSDSGIDPMTVKVHHSRFNVVSFDIVVDDSTLKLYNPILPNGVDLQGAAVQSGSYLDADGNRLPEPIPIVSDLYQPDLTTLAWSVDSDGNLVTQEARVTEALLYDRKLNDSANTSGIASHFRDNGSTPSGWTQVVAPGTSVTSSKYSIWELTGSSSNTQWKFRRQTSINIESTAASQINSFIFGVGFRDGKYTADLDLYLGMYRNNAGSIDENTYSRVHLWWDSANSLWKIRGEEKDGATAHTSASWTTLDQNPIINPIFVRFFVQNVAAKTARSYFGSIPDPKMHQLLLNQNPSAAPTWGQCWLQLERTRGAGVSDITWLYSVDYSTDAF